MKLFRQESHTAKYDAQLNLSGLTHYVDDDTLKFHKSRILDTYITDGGLLFALIESCAADFENSHRVFRPVIFDVLGNVIERPNLDDSHNTKKQAVSAMWDALNSINAVEITEKALTRHIEQAQREVDYFRKDLASLIAKNAA